MDPYPIVAQTLRESDVIVRQSTIGSMNLCPARVGYAEQDGYVEAVSEALVFGTAVHYLCEQHVINPKGQSKIIQPANFNKFMEELLVNEYDWSIKQIGEKAYKTFRRKVIDAYRLWVLQVFEYSIKDEDTLAVEEGLWVHIGDIGDRRVIAHGTPDLVLGSWMEDNKTTNAAFKWTQEKADAEIQPTLYLAMFNLTHGTSITDFKYRIYDRKKEDWDTLKTSRSLEAQDAMFKTAYQYGVQIAAGAFPATPVVEEYKKFKRGWYCSPKWCGAWNICDMKQTYDDGTDFTQVAIREWR